MLRKLAGVYSEVVPRYSPVSRRTFNRWILMLPGAGCEYWKRTGGCTMCGFHNATKKYSGGRIYPAPLFNLLRWVSEKGHARSRPAELAVFMGGSFWCDREIPARAQESLYAAVARHPSLDTLMVETRCEYITEAKVGLARRRLNGKTLKVGIGLESQNEHIRNRLICKGLPRHVFERKVALLRSHGAQVLAYVFLKPLGVDEKAAVDDVLKTVEYTLSAGVTEIELSCAFVQAETPLARFFASGDYRPPWLWSVVEVLREAEKRTWPLTVGRFTDEPPPIAAAANCPDCSPRFEEAIEEFRRTGRVGEVPNCPCRAEWAKEMSPC
jgi:archaeosine synthase beta-subunit